MISLMPRIVCISSDIFTTSQHCSTCS